MLSDFTPSQITRIADGYQLMARTLAEFQLVRWTDFTYEQQLDLNAYQNSLLNRAHDLQNRSTNPAVDQADVLTNTIVQTIGHTCKRLHITTNLVLALTLGALIVALASYVARANPKGIESAVDELHHLLETENV